MNGVIQLPQFMISDGSGLYLRRDASGNYIPVKNKALGDIYEQREKASNVLLNCISKNLRGRYKIIKVEDSIIPNQNMTVSKYNMLNKSKDDVVKQIGNEPIEENELSDLSVNIDNLAVFVQNAEQRREALTTALSDVDKEISDINHYIEFGQFNAYQGWLAFKMLRGRLKKRRKIKDELQILIQLGECKVNSAMIEDIKASIEKLDTREYQPRKLNELFK